MTFFVTLPECFWHGELFITGNCDVSFGLGFLVPTGCFQCLRLQKNQLQIRLGTCRARLLSTRRTRYLLMNKEWTSPSSRVATVTHKHTHAMFTRVRKHGDRHTHTREHLCRSHTCQSCFSLTARRKGERETQQFAGLELLASVGLVGLSIHVRRQRLSDSLFNGWWAWALRTEGFWHCVYLWALRMFLCVFMCVLLVFERVM